MIGYVRFKKDRDDEDRESYHCSRCGTFISDSDLLIPIQGKQDHSFVNPTGIQCNFKTFSQCKNVAVDQEIYLQHSWFRGYGWRFVMCRTCWQHLGWKYDAVEQGATPPSFFGILVETVDPLTQSD